MIWAPLLQLLGLDRIPILTLITQLADADLAESVNLLVYAVRCRGTA